MQLVILSSYDKFEYVKATFLNGVVDYILKPTLNPEILLSTLKKVAGKFREWNLSEKKLIPFKARWNGFYVVIKKSLDEALFVEYFPHTLYRLFGDQFKKVCGNQKIR